MGIAGRHALPRFEEPPSDDLPADWRSTSRRPRRLTTT